MYFPSYTKSASNKNKTSNKKSTSYKNKTFKKCVQIKAKVKVIIHNPL